MELDDLKQKWVEYDAKLDKSLRLNARLLRESGLGRVEAALKPLSRSIVVEGTLNLAAVFLLGSFLGNHVAEPRFAVPAALLLACAIAIMSTGIRQWLALRTIDYGAPVVAIQKRLAALRIGRIRTTKWILIGSPLLWTPLLIVSVKALTGLDPYAFLNARFLAGNLLFGLAFLFGMLWLSKRQGGRWNQSPAVRRLMDDIAGRSLVTATGALDEIERFEREP
jgi:hypothetical protein